MEEGCPGDVNLNYVNIKVYIRDAAVLTSRNDLTTDPRESSGALGKQATERDHIPYPIRWFIAQPPCLHPIPDGSPVASRHTEARSHG